MRWAFRILAGLNLLVVAFGFLYQPPGEDPAGTGMRLGLAALYAIYVGAAVGIHVLVKARWVEVAMVVLLALPAVWALYILSLSL